MEAMPFFSHTGLTCADIEVSKRFYCDGLGFDFMYEVEPPKTVSKIILIDGDFEMKSAFLQKGSLRVELMQFDAPLHGYPNRPINQRGGPTHLAFQVGDIDEITRKLVSLGGEVLPDRRLRTSVMDGEEVELQICLDPDGTVLELCKSSPGLLKAMFG